MGGGPRFSGSIRRRFHASVFRINSFHERKASPRRRSVWEPLRRPINERQRRARNSLNSRNTYFPSVQDYGGMGANVSRVGSNLTRWLEPFMDTSGKQKQCFGVDPNFDVEGSGALWAIQKGEV